MSAPQSTAPHLPGSPLKAKSRWSRPEGLTPLRFSLRGLLFGVEFVSFFVDSFCVYRFSVFFFGGGGGGGEVGDFKHAFEVLLLSVFCVFIFHHLLDQHLDL